MKRCSCAAVELIWFFYPAGSFFSSFFFISTSNPFFCSSFALSALVYLFLHCFNISLSLIRNIQGYLLLDFNSPLSINLQRFSVFILILFLFFIFFKQHDMNINFMMTIDLTVQQVGKKSFALLYFGNNGIEIFDK